MTLAKRVVPVRLWPAIGVVVTEFSLLALLSVWLATMRVSADEWS